MDLLDPLAQSFDHAATVFAGVDSQALDVPTPCTEWTLRTLLGHTLGVVTNMGLGARGEELLPVTTVALDPDLGAQFRSAADATLAAWTARGLDGDVNVGAGPMPVAAALCVNLIDTTAHSWDIARATGQPAELPDGLAQTVLVVGEGFITDQLRERVGFNAPVAVPADASATDQLVAFLGRRP